MSVSLWQEVTAVYYKRTQAPPHSLVITDWTVVCIPRGASIWNAGTANWEMRTPVHLWHVKLMEGARHCSLSSTNMWAYPGPAGSASWEVTLLLFGSLDLTSCVGRGEVMGQWRGLFSLQCTPSGFEDNVGVLTFELPLCVWETQRKGGAAMGQFKRSTNLFMCY